MIYMAKTLDMGAAMKKAFDEFGLGQKENPEDPRYQNLQNLFDMINKNLEDVELFPVTHVIRKNKETGEMVEEEI